MLPVACHVEISCTLHGCDACQDSGRMSQQRCARREYAGTRRPREVVVRQCGYDLCTSFVVKRVRARASTRQRQRGQRSERRADGRRCVGVCGCVGVCACARVRECQRVIAMGECEARGTAVAAGGWTKFSLEWFEPAEAHAVHHLRWTASVSHAEVVRRNQTTARATGHAEPAGTGCRGSACTSKCHK